MGACAVAALLPRHIAGQRNVYFNLTAIVGWLGTALLHAALTLSMVMSGADATTADRDNGHTWSLQQNGLLMFTIVIITVHLQLSVVLDQWTWMHHVAIWGSIGAPCTTHC
jgi:phospholipid-transporting ATPase